jgi:hypothetical protein
VNVRGRKRPAQVNNAEAIALVAYQLFRQRGGVHGHDLEDWIKAERIVRARSRARG